MEEKTRTVCPLLKATLIKYSSALLWSVYNQIWNVPGLFSKSPYIIFNDNPFSRSLQIYVERKGNLIGVFM
jgi:hypothetical protein